jgi:hypothetical protein
VCVCVCVCVSLCVICVICICSGYFTYFDATTPNVVDLFPTDAVSTVVRVAMICNCVVAYVCPPLTHYSALLCSALSLSHSLLCAVLCSVPYTLFIARASVLSVVQLWKPQLVLKVLLLLPSQHSALSFDLFVCLNRFYFTNFLDFLCVCGMCVVHSTWTGVTTLTRAAARIT